MSIQICSVCGVAVANETIQFATGNAGTQAQLYARVCRYVPRQGCINRDAALIGEITREDGFPSEHSPIKRAYPLLCMR